MVPILQFIGYVGSALLGLLILAIVIYAILSWLVAFDVVNMRNRFVYQVSHALEGVVRPMLRPLQRIIPPLGGVDITPLILLIVLQGIRAYLWPALITWLIGLFGGGAAG